MGRGTLVQGNLSLLRQEILHKLQSWDTFSEGSHDSGREINKLTCPSIYSQCVAVGRS